MRLPLGKNETRPAAGRVPAGFSAAYSTSRESRSPEELPQLLKLTHPPNIRCYNLIQESNDPMYPSSTEEKDKRPSSSQRQAQWVSLGSQPRGSRAVCVHHTLCPWASTLSSDRDLLRGCARGWFYHLYLVRGTLLSLEQGGTTENELSPWGGHQREILYIQANEWIKWNNDSCFTVLNTLSGTFQQSLYLYYLEKQTSKEVLSLQKCKSLPSKYTNALLDQVNPLPNSFHSCQRRILLFPFSSPIVGRHTNLPSPSSRLVWWTLFFFSLQEMT